MKITNFDKSNLKALRPALQAALDKVTAEYGVVLSLGTIRFDSNSFRTKLEGRVSGNGIKVHAPEYDSLTIAANLRGYEDKVLNDDDVKKTFKIGRKNYQILGAKLSYRKMPVIARDLSTNKLFKFSVVTVAEALGRKFKLSITDQIEQDDRAEEAVNRAEARAS